MEAMNPPHCFPSSEWRRNSTLIPRYLRNRLTGSTVTDGTKTVTLVSNTYDGAALTNITGGLTNHDSAFGTTLANRNNVTKAITPTGTMNYTYDITGTAVTANNANSYSVAVTNGSSSNYAAPSLIAFLRRRLCRKVRCSRFHPPND
jgi:hypothetical protein